MTAGERQAYHNGPAALAIADAPAGHRRIRAAANAMGARLVGAISIAEAEVRLARQAGLDIALLDCQADAGEAFDRLLDVLDQAAREGRFRSIVAVPFELVDAADARISHHGVALLCQPDPIEMAAEIGLAAVRQPLVLNATDRNEAAELARLGEEVARIAEALTRMSSGEEGEPPGDLREAPFAYRAEPIEGRAVSADAVRRLIRGRRMRDRFFDGALFADPAWDILLDLMAARIEGRPVSVSSLCIAAAVPATTALRWIRTMTERGLLEREADPRDGRRVYIRLGDKAADAVSAWFAATRADLG